MTQAVAQRKTLPICLPRGQQHKFHALITAEEEEFDAQLRTEMSGMPPSAPEAGKTADGTNTFEEYREKSKAAGVM